MMAEMAGIVEGDILRYGQGAELTVGGPGWFVWLASASRFVVLTPAGRITVRKEQAGNKHGRWYWRAYRKYKGVLHRVYLGSNEELTAVRLAESVAELLDPAVSDMRTSEAIHPASKRSPQHLCRGRKVSSEGSEGGDGVAILATKLMPPVLRSGLVSRPRLEARLRAGTIGPLTLLVAPAGFGKTTLLAQALGQAPYGRQLASRGRQDEVGRTAWLTLDTSDDEPLRFLLAIGATLDAVCPGAVRGLLGLLRADEPPALSVLLNRWVQDLLGQSVPITLVLDDYHTLRSQVLHQLVSGLIERMPPSLRLVIAGRSEPPLLLARLRASGELTEVTAEDLRLDHFEVGQLLRQVGGHDLGEPEVLALAERTEGWAAGLQLASLALRDQADPAGFIADFAGTHRFIMDYLIEEVLRRQPAELRRFLLETSVLEQLSGPLCDALLEAPLGSSQPTLEEIERRGLFLVALDSARHWYRYHQLFGEVLRAELRREVGVEQIAMLRQRAAAWLAARPLAKKRAAADGPELLTVREREVLNLVAAGASNAMIAAQLVVAVSTVKAHVNNLFGKLGVSSRTQALARARELGLL